MPAGPDPLLEDSQGLLALEADAAVLSALKPAEDGDGLVARVLNPTDAPDEVALRWGLPIAEALAVRLDERLEEQDRAPIRGIEPNAVQLVVLPHALRSVRVRPA